LALATESPSVSRSCRWSDRRSGREMGRVHGGPRRSGDDSRGVSRLTRTISIGGRRMRIYDDGGPRGEGLERPGPGAPPSRKSTERPVPGGSLGLSTCWRLDRSRPISNRLRLEPRQLTETNRREILGWFVGRSRMPRQSLISCGASPPQPAVRESRRIDTSSPDGLNPVQAELPLDLCCVDGCLETGGRGISRPCSKAET
jgi:hypothetical protein